MAEKFNPVCLAMRKSDVACPTCKTGYRGIETAPRESPDRCRRFDQLLETF